jgi:hypothetical protein
MPVKLTRAVERETAVIVGGRTVIIRLEEGGRVLKFRRKGLRTEGWVTLSIEAAFWAAARATYGLAAGSNLKLGKRLRGQP